MYNYDDLEKMYTIKVFIKSLPIYEWCGFYKKDENDHGSKKPPEQCKSLVSLPGNKFMRENFSAIARSQTMMRSRIQKITYHNRFSCTVWICYQRYKKESDEDAGTRIEGYFMRFLYPKCMVSFSME